jgi:3',5'-cyclic-AMP phosphodiesterase
VLVSGDLADTGADDEYAVLKAALDAVDAPTHVLPGNHDDRARLRRHFGLPGESDAPVDYAIDIGPIRLVALDTTIPGADGGGLSRGQLEWLERELTAAPDRATMIAMHHPPFQTGMPLFDAIGIGATDRAKLADVVRQHPQVRRIIAGHVHRGITAQIGGRIAMSAPSTYAQPRLDFSATTLRLSDEPAGFAVHALDAGELVSHIQLV